jgi:hypothetical protein
MISVGILLEIKPSSRRYPAIISLTKSVKQEIKFLNVQNLSASLLMEKFV